jgi:threonine aldolase
MKLGSDNQTGASSEIMAALNAANVGHEHSYGTDSWSARAIEALRNTFECDLDAYFVTTGTAANALALSCLARPWNAILCHDQSHILLDELTAPEFFTGGARLVGISKGEGKLQPWHLDDHFRNVGRDAPHNAAATVLSLAQCSENGLAYTPQELTALTESARRYHLKVHVDGARFANAVAAVGCSPADMSWRAGVDVLSLGATKNGALCSEVVLFFDRRLADEFAYRRKRAGHLVSKSRFIAAQMLAWLHNDHWLVLAGHANAQARRLAGMIGAMSGARLVWPCDANEVFAVMPRSLVDRLSAAGAEFYDWPSSALPLGQSLQPSECFVRMVASFLTSNADLDAFRAIVSAFGETPTTSTRIG